MGVIENINKETITKSDIGLLAVFRTLASVLKCSLRMLNNRKEKGENKASALFIPR